MYLRLTIRTFAIACLIFITACGSLSVADGVTQMKATIVDVQKSVDSGDANAAKQAAAELEETWEKFEDQVKKENRQAYDQIETPLHAIQSGAGSATLDKVALKKSLQDLSAALELVNKK